MTPFEIIDKLLTHLTVKEMMIMTKDGMQSRDLTEAQDIVFNANGPKDDSNPVYAALSILQLSSDPVTLAHYEWAERVLGDTGA